MSLTKALPPYTSMPISYLEKQIKGAILVPIALVYPESDPSRVAPTATIETVVKPAGSEIPPDDGLSASELHKATVDKARTILAPFFESSKGYGIIDCSVRIAGRSNISIGLRTISAHEICFLEIQLNGQLSLYALAANIDLGDNDTLVRIANRNMLPMLCYAIEQSIPPGVQCFGMLMVGSKITFYHIMHSADHPGCIVRALDPTEIGAGRPRLVGDGWFVPRGSR